MEGVSLGYFLLLGTTILAVTAAALTLDLPDLHRPSIAGYTHTQCFWGVCTS
jgi:hypothetical protein